MRAFRRTGRVTAKLRRRPFSQSGHSRERYAETLVGVFAAWEANGVDPSEIVDLAAMLTFAPPGHFYSPIPAPSQISGRFVPEELPGIDFDLDTLLTAVADAAEHLPLPERRYDPGNDQFGPTDALVLTAMIRSRTPRQIIEVGSGHSTAVMLDATDDLAIRPTLAAIEPFPERVRSIVLDGDLDRIELIEEPVQSIALERFCELEGGDILFLDTTHVVNPGSDVVYEFLEILPRLTSGVIVHIHDIVYPFDIPEPWLAEGRIWNEPYLLRALLTNNPRYRIIQWVDALARLRPEDLRGVLPEGTVDTGTSLWLEVV